MKKMTSELSLTLSDDTLATVSGGHLKRKLLLPYPWFPSKSVTQSNSVGDINVSADGSSGSVSISVTQSNQA